MDAGLIFRKENLEVMVMLLLRYGRVKVRNGPRVTSGFQPGQFPGSHMHLGSSSSSILAVHLKQPCVRSAVVRGLLSPRVGQDPFLYSQGDN